MGFRGPDREYRRTPEAPRPRPRVPRIGRAAAAQRATALLGWNQPGSLFELVASKVAPLAGEERPAVDERPRCLGAGTRRRNKLWSEVERSCHSFELLSDYGRAVNLPPTMYEFPIASTLSGWSSTIQLPSPMNCSESGFQYFAGWFPAMLNEMASARSSSP